jgi:hypothetical protein
LGSEDQVSNLPFLKLEFLAHPLLQILVPRLESILLVELVVPDFLERESGGDDEGGG